MIAFRGNANGFSRLPLHYGRNNRDDNRRDGKNKRRHYNSGNVFILAGRENHE